MSGIRDLLGFQFWVDNAKRAPLEALLHDKKNVPKDRAAILRELEEERRPAIKHGNKNFVKTTARS